MLKNASQHEYQRALDWEDAAAVLNACGPIEGDIVSIGGAGDIALSLLTKSSTSLTVICLSESERMLFELKLQAIRILHPDNVYNLLGIHPSGRRVFVYHQLRTHLSEEAQRWWDQHENIIREGLTESGEQEIRHQRLKLWMKRLRLMTPKMKVESLKRHKRWKLLEPILSTVSGSEPPDDFWSDTNPYAHMMFHEQWSIDSIQTGAQTLSYAGMESIKQSKSPLNLVTGSFMGWMNTEPSHAFAIIYLGSLCELHQQQHTDSEFWSELSRVLSSTGMLLCWSSSEPQTPLFTWQRYLGHVRSVHSGYLWIARA